MNSAKGSCHCGSVSFEVRGSLRDVIYCHCEQCRKQSGHFVAATRAEDRALNIKGADNLTWYEASADAKRGFCSNCGSLMFWKAHDSENTSIMAGSFDTPSGLKAGFHIYTRNKGDYYEICDGLQTFEQAD